MNYQGFWLTKCPRCGAVSISHSGVFNALCKQCSLQYRVQLKKHLNRVVGNAKTLEEAREKRSKMVAKKMGLA